jgi:hypothetical protein
MLGRSYATGSDPGGAVLTGGALFMPVIEDDVLTRNRELTIRKDHSKAGSDVLSHGSHATCPQLKPPRRLRVRGSLRRAATRG